MQPGSPSRKRSVSATRVNLSISQPRFDNCATNATVSSSAYHSMPTIGDPSHKEIIINAHETEHVFLYLVSL